MSTSCRPRHHAVDFGVLARFEGRVATGYVPTHTRPPNRGEAIGQSGVTVGMGVDLGCRQEDDLLRLGLDPSLLVKLRPYLGKRRQAAQRALAACPLRLTGDEVLALDAAVASEIIGRLAARYDAALTCVPCARRFHELPWQAQTVLASLAWQYGENLPRATPRFWALATRQDWRAVIAELECFGDAYAPRRRQEAKLLREMLAAPSEDRPGFDQSDPEPGAHS